MSIGFGIFLVTAGAILAPGVRDRTPGDNEGVAERVVPADTEAPAQSVPEPARPEDRSAERGAGD
jgi:hypothetical protein